MATNNTFTMLHTLKQYDNCGITLTFKNQYNQPCLTVSYVNQQYKINFFREASFLTFADVDSAYFAIERAMQ